MFQKDKFFISPKKNKSFVIYYSIQLQTLVKWLCYGIKINSLPYIAIEACVSHMNETQTSIV